MKIINVLHITDLHFSSGPPVTPMVHMADPALNGVAVDQAYTSNSQERFLAQILGLTNNVQVNMIACTGDLTDGFNTVQLENGANYLLALAERLGVDPNRIVVSPGNHDVNRKAKAGEELDEFCQICKGKGFICPDLTSLATLDVEGLHIVALNSCIGALEHAQHGLPADFWKKEREKLESFEEILSTQDVTAMISDDVKYQAKCMDIPLLGFPQLDKLLEYVRAIPSDCVLVLMHHNPLPTDNIEIRPYAHLLDAGPLLYGLLNTSKHVVVLHGHTHCMAGLSAYAHAERGAGFVAAAGNRGLSSDQTSSASLIQTFLGDDCQFIRANVFLFERNASSFRKRFAYTIRKKAATRLPMLDKIVALPVNETLTFEQVANHLILPVDCNLADSLIDLDPTVLDIANISESYTKWRITRYS